jgi:RNA polymerase sigma-70 factor, ECF subfamily
MLPSSLKSRPDEEPVGGRQIHLVASGPAQKATERREGSSLTDAEEPGNPEATWDDGAPALLERARAGDPDAFQAIFKRFGKPLAAFLYHLTGDRARAEELTQETFFRTFRGLNRMQQGCKLSTWIFGIARNVAHEALRDVRRSRREVGLQDGAHLLPHDAGLGPEGHLTGGELRGAIRRALLDLSEDQRTVFVLKLLHQMRYQEISAIMGHSVGKLKTDLHRARQLMRERLQPYVAWKIQEM